MPDAEGSSIPSENDKTQNREKVEGEGRSAFFNNCAVDAIVGTKPLE